MDIAQINRAIISGEFTNDQLNSIADAIKFARSQLAKQNRGQMVIGTKVKFRNSRTNTITYGTVDKVNIKFILVRESRPNALTSTVWRVPASMLETA